MYNNNIVNFRETTTILNACTKKSRNLLNSPRMLWFFKNFVFDLGKKYFSLKKSFQEIYYFENIILKHKN